VCHTLLKAWEMSNAAEQYCLVSRAAWIHWTTQWVCSMVERMSLSEAKLVIGDETVGGNQWEETV
jgi:hypothetical protein